MAWQLSDLIRNIPDFPEKGIVYRDITPLLHNPKGLFCAIEEMAMPFRFGPKIDIVAGPESRGFIFGAAIAQSLSAGFVPIRKPGRLPGKTISASYELEYGTDSLEMHSDAIHPGDRVLMVDDLLATGGTMKACCDLVGRLCGEVIGCSFLIELAFLNGRKELGDYDICSLITYEE